MILDIQNTINYQKSKGPGEEEKILIIADDLPGLAAKPDSMIYSSSSYLRHLNCSIIYISQIYKGKVGGLSPTVRNNLDAMVMFRCPSSQQIKSFTEDLSGTFSTKENVNNMLEYATKEPFQFAYFNYRDLEVWKNHTDKLWSKYTPDGKYSPDFQIPNDIPKKWKNDTGNSWLSRAKVVRACTGELNCQFIKCYKINQWASRSIELEREPPKFSPSSPTNSEFSTLDDYSTCEETEGESDE